MKVEIDVTEVKVRPECSRWGDYTCPYSKDDVSYANHENYNLDDVLRNMGKMIKRLKDRVDELERDLGDDY